MYITGGVNESASYTSPVTCFAYAWLTLAERFASIGQQSNVTSSLDCHRQLALVAGTRAGLAAWANLAVVRDEAAQRIHQFIVDHGIFIRAELALAGAAEKAPSAHTTLLFRVNWLITHRRTPLFVLLRKQELFRILVAIKLGSRTAIAPLVEHDHFTGYDLGRNVLVAFLIFPMAGLQAAFDINQAIFG